MTEQKLIELLQCILEEAAEEDADLGGLQAYTFADGGLLTRDAGLVLKLPGGDEFQLTVVQSQFSPEAREACPGCGAMPGDGPSPWCDDPDGCGFWRNG